MADQERKGAVTFKGNPLTLIGAELKAGDKAPDFKLLAGDLSEVTLASSKGKTRLLSVVPSLDTPVCDLQTKRFNEEAGKLPSDVIVFAVSCDLPFAQKRWCGAANASKIQTLSDHRDTSFGKAYGVLIKELRLLARSIFIIDANDKIQYVEYVKEVTEHPNYEKALASLKAGSRA
ncbi:MAG: thiol peroxidase [Candidatus Omnitrophica bacterium]|nr:thiol peroxidase [Candidatus Omnitrophota bacterium]